MASPTAEQLQSFDFLAQEAFTAPFFGVDHNCFKLGERVFEAVEDESDGYRSCLGSVEVRAPNGKVFFPNPIDTVYLSRVSEPVDPKGHEYVDGFDLYRLTSIDDGHVWLEFGTENVNDYYPGFVFRYHPRKERA